MKEQETWEENSIEARLQKLQAAIEALSNALIDSGIASWFIDLGTTAASGLEGLIDGVGTLSTLVTTLGIALGATNFGFLQFNEDGSSTNIVKEFIGNISGFKKSNYNMNKTFVDEFKKAYNANSSSVNIGDIFTNNSKLDKNKINNIVLKTAQGLADGVIDELGTLDESFNNTVGSANKFGSSIKQFFGNLGISLAIGIAISTIEKLITSYDNMIAKAQEATNKFNEQKATISDYKTQISSLREEIASGTLSYSETLEKNKELLEIQNDLVETYGAQAKGIDLVNGSLKEQNDILDSINEKNRQQWENEVNDLSDASDIWNYVTSGSKFIYKGITSPSLFNIPTQIERVGEAFENIENYGISSDVLEESFQILIDYQDTATGFWGTNIDQIRDKVENFNKSFDLTNVKVLNDYIESFDNITKVGDAFEISGNVEDVVDTITTIQTELEGITGYNDEIDQQLTKIANDAQDIIDNHLSTYYDIIENDIMKDDGLSEYYKQLTEAYLAYQQSVEDGESEDLQEKKLNDYSSILNEIITNGSISESIKNYFINLYPDIQSIVDSWVLSPKIEAQVSDIEGISLFDNYSKDEILALDKERLSEASTLTEKEKQELEKLHELAEDSGLNLDLYLAKLYELGKVQEGIYKINQHFGYGNKETWQTEQAEKFLDNAKQFETANKTKQTNQSANKSNSGLNSFNLLPDERNNNVSTTNILLENNLEKRQELINRTNEETEALQKQYDDAINRFANGSTQTLDDATAQYQEVIDNEYQKIQDWGLGDYEQQIKDGTIQSVFGNVDMDKRTIITWSDELKKTYKDALDSWDYDPEVGGIDTVWGGSDRFGEDLNEVGWQVAFTPILPDGTFLNKDTVYDYIESILAEAYTNDGKITEDELTKIDAQGRQIGNTFIHGIFAGIDDSQNYDNNGNWAETVGRLLHFSGDFGAVEIAKREKEKAIKEFSDSNVDLEKFFADNSINTTEEIDYWNKVTEGANSAKEAVEMYNKAKVPSLAPVDKKQTVTVEEQNNQNINKALQKYAEENAEDFKIGLEFDEDFSNLDGYLDFAKKAKGNTEEWTNAYGETYEILTDEAILECIEKWIEKAKEAKSVTEKVTTSYKDLATSLNTLQGDFSGDDSKFQEALGKIQKGQPVDSTIIDSFSDEIKGLSGFEGFTRSMMDVSKTADEQKKALEKLATEYLMQSGLVKNITEDNKDYVISELAKMNITNASAIAEQALIERYGAEKYAIQELVNYHVKLGETKYTTATASAELENATLSEIYSMIEEAEAAGQNTAALRQMLVEKVKACQVTLATDGDISNLKKLVKTLGGTTEAFEAYARLKAEVNSGKWDSNPTEAQVQLAYYREQMKIASNAVLKQDVEMDTNVSLNYNPTTDKSSSTDSTKEEAGEVFDFIEIRLQNLMDMASKAKDKIDDLLSFGSKRKQTIQAINKTTKAIKAEIKAAKEYAKYADKVAKEAASDTSTSSTEKITSTVGKTIAQEAQKYVGVLPYVYGGKSLTSGADCSGFVQSLYAQYGISIPRVSSDQWNDSNATYVAKEDLQAGDLVFFASGGSASNPGHVGLYIGNGKMVHEPQDGEKAKISSIDWVDYVGGKHYASLGNSYGTNTTTTTKKTYNNKELERYKKLVRQGLISDDAIKTIKDENLSKAISDYKDWYEKSQDCIESIETLTDSLKELYETLAQNPIEKAADRVEDLDNAIELRNAQQENLKVSQTKQYKNLNDKNITAYKKEEKAYKTASDTTDKKYNSAVKEANKAQKSALKLAKKVKAKNSGLTVAELKKVRSILKAGTKEIPAKYLAKMTNQKLINKCLDYNEALIAETKMEQAKETANQNYALAKETTKRQTAELQKDTFDQFQEDYENKIYEKERKSQQAQNKLDLREAQGKYASAKQLKIQLSAEEDKLKLLEEEETKLRTQLKLIPEGTPEWYEAKEALAGVVDEQNECLVTQEEINDAINNIPIDKLNDAIEEFESLRSVISSTIELLEKRYRNVSSSLYEKDIEYIKGEISKNKGLAELYRQQYEEEVAKGNDQAASEALVNWKNAESTSNSLYSAMEDTYDAIWQNELSAYENIATKIEYAQSNIQSLLGIIQDEMLVDNDTGELTDYGLAKESLYLEQFGNANEEVSTYKAELAELEEMWANGQSGLSENEYLEKKAELYQNLTDAVNDQVSAVQALIDITEQQMQAELNALKEVIDARVEALNEKKAYYDYDKNIRSQTKDIQSLDNQIAALKSAEDTYENRKELKLLEAQRQEAQEQLDETQLDHQIELLTNGLNDFYDEISEEYDDYIQELKSSTEAQHELVQTIKGAVASVPEIVEQATEAALATYGLQGTNILRDTDWQKSVPEQQVTKEEEIQPDLSVLDDENTDSTNSNTTAVNTNTTAVNTNTTAVNDLTAAINSLNSSGSGNVESVTLDAKAVYFGAVASEVTGGGITGSVDWSGTAKFATGGIVRSGISDRTNDKLLVRVNPDETILTKDFTDMLPTTVDIMKDLVKMPTVVPTTYSNSPVVNVSYDNLIRIDGNADSNTIAEVKKLMPEIVRQTSTSIARQMKRNGF